MVNNIHNDMYLLGGLQRPEKNRPTTDPSFSKVLTGTRKNFESTTISPISMDRLLSPCMNKAADSDITMHWYI